MRWRLSVNSPWIAGKWLFYCIEESNRRVHCRRKDSVAFMAYSASVSVASDSKLLSTALYKRSFISGMRNVVVVVVVEILIM